ncbi:hypothetical protein GCM10007893_18750 [Paracoccus marinus]|nr:hypothetical protein GCM10007893_18750 [Paracoccus marinus]
MSGSGVSFSHMGEIWSELGLDEPAESARDVRRAYARRLKAAGPDQSAEDFQRLRDAYELALRLTDDDEPRRRVSVVPAAALDGPAAPPRPTYRKARSGGSTAPQDATDAGARVPAYSAPPPDDDTEPHDDANPEPPISVAAPWLGEAQGSIAQEPGQAHPREGANELDRQPPPDEATDALSADHSAPLPSRRFTAAPAPTPWGGAAPEAILPRIDSLLRSRVYDPEAWRPILASVALEDRLVRDRAEAMMVAHLSEVRPPAEWVRLIDQRFGWRSDFVGFRRRFPDAVEYLDRIDPASAPMRPAGVQSGIRPAFIWIFAGILAATLYIGNVGEVFVLEAFGAAMFFAVMVTAVQVVFLRFLLSLMSVVVRYLPIVVRKRVSRLRLWWARPIRGQEKLAVFACAHVALVFVVALYLLF